MVSPSSSSHFSSFFPPLASSSKPLLLASLFALALFYLLNPSFHWRLAKTAVHRSGHCFPCSCDCELAGGSSMLLSSCGHGDRHEAVDPKSMEQLKQEIKLHETVALQTQGRLDAGLLDAKRWVSQYQKEADKCSSGMETCELARERSEAALAEEKRRSAMWEKRARELGWLTNSPKHMAPPTTTTTSFFDRFGLSSAN